MTQHVRQPLRSQSLSDHAAPDLTYDWIQLSSVVREFALLLGPMIEEVGHHHEQSPLDPDYSQYLHLELAGVLRFLAVRDHGRLVGFLLCTVGPHMDFMSTRWASILKLYLMPAYRRGGRAPKMLRMAHAMMRKSGVKIVTAASRTGYTTARQRGVASLLEFAGYSPIETVYAKALE